MNKTMITKILARQIFDSRGNPTVEADVYLSDGGFGRASVPSGASTGSKEALELRDGGHMWMGKGVSQAVDNIKNKIAPALIGRPVEQTKIDNLLIKIDDTKDKSALGANAILAVSLAVAKAEADSKKLPFYRHISELSNLESNLPMPMMNIMNGGAHADGSSDIQEYMIVPIGVRDFTAAMQMGTEIFHNLKKILKENNYQTTVGDEGGFAPNLKNGNQEPLELIAKAVSNAGYILGKDVALALDVAASELYENDKYNLKTEKSIMNADELIDLYANWLEKYPIISIEDGLAENDWDNWIKLTEKLGKKIQLVGDDLLVTNTKLLKKAIDKKACNAILIKPNQIGTLSETIKAVKLAKENGFNTIISHRSGETEDTSIAHLAIGLGAGQIKTGSLSRTDRVSKYNEILRIAEENPELKITKPF